MKKILLFFLSIFFFIFLLNRMAFSAPGRKITVDASISLSPISRFITGVHLTPRPFLYLNDRQKEELLDRLAPYLKEMGIGSIRWSKRNCKGKEDFTVAQVAKFAKTIGAEVLYILVNMAGARENLNGCNGFSGTSEDAADLVEYLNIPNNGSNPNGGINWARVRASDASYCQQIGVNPRLCANHPEPFNWKYFELGNEPWIAGVQPQKYGEVAKKFAEKMRAVDPSIHLTLVIDKGLGAALDVPGLRELVNGGQWHTYTVNMFHSFEEKSREIKENLGLDPALTEWNYALCFARGDKKNDPDWAHKLGHALFVTKVIQSLAAGKAFFGNFHNLNGPPGGTRCEILQIDSELSIKTDVTFYGFKLFKDRLGKTRIKDELEGNLPFSTLASKSEDKVFLLVINENIDDDVETEVKFTNLPFNPLAQMKVVTLNAPNLDSDEDVSLKDSKITLAEPKRSFSFSYKFPAHSTTVFTVEKEGAPPSFSLSPEWNEITWPDISDYTAKSALEDIDNDCGAGTAVAIARKTKDWWEDYVKNYGGENFSLQKTQEYFINISKACNWVP